MCSQSVCPEEEDRNFDVNLNAKVNTQVFGLYFVPAHNHKLYSVSKDRDTHARESIHIRTNSGGTCVLDCMNIPVSE